MKKHKKNAKRKGGKERMKKLITIGIVLCLLGITVSPSWATDEDRVARKGVSLFLGLIAGFATCNPWIGGAVAEGVNFVTKPEDTYLYHKGPIGIPADIVDIATGGVVIAPPDGNYTETTYQQGATSVPKVKYPSKVQEEYTSRYYRCFEITDRRYYERWQPTTYVYDSNGRLIRIEPAHWERVYY